jgi:hypothetical protein
MRGLGLAFHWRLVLAAGVPASVLAVLEAVYLRPALRPGTGLQFGSGAAGSGSAAAPSAPQHSAQQGPKVLPQLSGGLRGLCASCRPRWPVVRYKLLGFNALLAAMGLVYWITSEYERGLYTFWFVMLRTLGPYAYAAALAYFVLVDGWQSDAARADDMYHNLGRVLLRQPTAVPVPAARWHNLARVRGRVGVWGVCHGGRSGWGVSDGSAHTALNHSHSLTLLCCALAAPASRVPCACAVLCAAWLCRRSGLSSCSSCR